MIIIKIKNKKTSSDSTLVLSNFYISLYKTSSDSTFLVAKIYASD